MDEVKSGLCAVLVKGDGIRLNKTVSQLVGKAVRNCLHNLGLLQVDEVAPTGTAPPQIYSGQAFWTDGGGQRAMQPRRAHEIQKLNFCPPLCVRQAPLP